MTQISLCNVCGIEKCKHRNNVRIVCHYAMLFFNYKFTEKQIKKEGEKIRNIENIF